MDDREYRQRYQLPGPPPVPPDVLDDADAYLRTAHDTKAAALIAGLANEIRRLRQPVRMLPEGDHSLREALAEPVTVVEDGGLLPYEIRRLTDPVEILAREIATWRYANEGHHRAVTSEDRGVAREMLAALVAGPWHLVTYEPHGGLSGYETTDDGQRLTRATITQEWRP